MWSIITLVVVAVLLFTLGAIVRFSIVSPLKTRGARERLRRPEAGGLEALCGFAPSEELIAFYKGAPMVDFVEIFLADASRRPPKRWFLGDSIR